MNEETTIKPAETKNVKTNNKSVITKVAAIVLLIGIVGGLGFWGFTQSSKAKESSNRVNGLNKEKDELSTKVSNLEQELEKRKETTGEANIDKEAFQSVFLKTGQVYFGKITGISENQVTLENIYYLKDNGSGDTSLIKLGSELHGPQDKMFIEREDLSFWENLKNDSEVTTAIKEYEKQNP